MINTKTKNILENKDFIQGDKISWSVIVNGKVVNLNGKVSSIYGKTMCLIGKCIETGNWWRDYVSIHDKSIRRIN